MKVLSNSIIFTFRETVKNGMFSADMTTQGGLYIPASSEDSGKRIRTVDIKYVGPDVKYVKPGDAVLITPLMWSDEFKYNGTSYWKTIEDHIIAIVE